MKTFLAIAFSFFTFTIYGQKDSLASRVHMVEMSFDVKDPVLSFGSAVDMTFFGFGFGYYQQLKTKGYNFWGVASDFSFMGSASEVYTDIVDGETVDVRETTSSHMWNVYGVYRHFPNVYFKRFEPFVEACMGARMMTNNTTTTILDSDDSGELDFNRFHLSIAFGGGIGTEFFIGTNVFLHGKISYLTGTSAKYLAKKNDDLSPTIENFRLEKTQTDLINYQIGATFAF